MEDKTKQRTIKEEGTQVEGEVVAIGMQYLGVKLKFKRDGKDIEEWVNGFQKSDLEKFNRGDKLVLITEPNSRGGNDLIKLVSHEEGEKDEAMRLPDLLEWAHANGLAGITTEMLVRSDLIGGLCVFRATATFIVDGNERNFMGHGDAITSGPHKNTEREGKSGGNFSMAPHFIRFAESRAIGRALKFAKHEAKAEKKTEG